MQAVIGPKTTINAASIYAMRYSGATLRQIADRIGRTKERVRQILIENYGSPKHKLFSTRQLCKLSGLSRERIIKLYQASVIPPVREWDTSNGRYLLWSLATVERLTVHYDTYKLCKICHHPIPMGRRIFCSKQCYEEGHKYKYMSIEAKKRHLRNIKRYRDKSKRLAQTTLDR